MARYRGCVTIAAEIPPLTGGKWLLGVSAPVLGGWIAAAASTNTDVFSALFWLLAYLLVTGLAVFAWGATTERWVSPPRERTYRFTAVVLEESALGAISFFVFWLLVGN